MLQICPIFREGYTGSIENGDRQEVTVHPFLDFMKKPNPLYEFNASAVWRLQAIYLMLKGEGYFIIERYSDGTPAELWPVPTHWVQMTPYMGNPFYPGADNRWRDYEYFRR